MQADTTAAQLTGVSHRQVHCQAFFTQICGTSLVAVARLKENRRHARAHRATQP
ncbi:hypothetical protein [Rivihabitans pingtungensis]|uniref:hypothetical protein n=1 Tax=Rivihabitans pingtungensis TaxID=1054498 RepID=UPI001304EEA4|nr:hypothetical protein [Rivihabitans pingtungensis]